MLLITFVFFLCCPNVDGPAWVLAAKSKAGDFQAIYSWKQSPCTGVSYVKEIEKP